MQEAIANLVDPIIDYGLSLRERLEAGVPLNFDDEQAALKKLLLTELEALRWAEYGEFNAGPTHLVEEEQAFYGIRYALTCWLDELFIRYSPWAQAWAERKLEASLYGTQDGSSRFWQQAQQAEARPAPDALEVFYLCVMLGFRGEPAKHPEAIQSWISAARARLASCSQGAWQPPPALEPPTHVPPLGGLEKMQRMVFVCGMTMIVLIPFVVFFVARGS